ncbi:MAG: hypothetical protein ABIJ12_12000 [bacterium]
MLKLKNNNGYSLFELFIALLITSVMLASGYSFYVKMHNSTIAQADISDMQQNSRATLHEIVKTARMAGYKIGSHTPYIINGDTLTVFYSDTQPVDTFMFYLEDYSGSELAQFGSLEASLIPKKMMIKHNSESAAIYTDYIKSLAYTAVDASTLQITLVVQASKADEDFASNEGIRDYSCTQQVNLRNINL